MSESTPAAFSVSVQPIGSAETVHHARLDMALLGMAHVLGPLPMMHARDDARWRALRDSSAQHRRSCGHRAAGGSPPHLPAIRSVVLQMRGILVSILGRKNDLLAVYYELAQKEAWINFI
jgi:hypothetical protein